MIIQERNLNLGPLTYNNSPNKIILHHAEASSCSIDDINSWHKEKGWSGVGYHYFVRKDGYIYRGRPEDAQGSHCSGQNCESIGICFEGTYMTETMPQEQFNAGVELIATIRSRRGNLPIYGHKEFYATDCPGTNFPLDGFKGGTYNLPCNNQSKTSLLDKAREYVGLRCKELQENLIAKGYACGGYGADGSFGEGTLNSLIKFQKDNGLEADGLAGELTFEKLTSAYVAPVQGNDWIRRLQQECNNQGFSNQSMDGISGTNTLKGCPTLGQGSSGEITRLLQEKLVILGYNTNGIDGIFGSGTLEAVMAFQGVNCLSQDGVVGHNTWSKLLEL